MNKKKQENKSNFLFGRKNYTLMLIGIAVIVIGFILMAGGGSDDPAVFNEEIYNFRRIRLAPTLVLIGLGIEEYYGWPSGHWVPITIMVVMSAQKHFGAAVQKALMRFLGTIVGVLLSVLVLWLFGDNTIVVFCTIFLAAIIFRCLIRVNVRIFEKSELKFCSENSSYSLIKFFFIDSAIFKRRIKKLVVVV